MQVLYAPRKGQASSSCAIQQTRTPVQLARIQDRKRFQAALCTSPTPQQKDGWAAGMPAHRAARLQIRTTRARARSAAAGTAARPPP